MIAAAKRKLGEAWARLEESSPSSPDDYEKSLKAVWHGTVCVAEEARKGAPYVIRGLLRHIDDRFQAGSPHPAALAADFLDEEKCLGARGLSEEDKIKLRKIRDRPPVPPDPAPTTPKQ